MNPDPEPPIQNFYYTIEPPGGKQNIYGPC